MERRIITVYCLIDEFLKAMGIKDDVRAEVSNSEILLVGYLAASDFGGNYRKAHHYCQMLGMVSRSIPASFVESIGLRDPWR